MNAESISSNECVAEPSTSESMRIQPISYMNDDSAVPKLTASRIRRTRRDTSSPTNTGAPVPASRDGAATGSAPASVAPRETMNTAAATTRFIAAAAASVPGRPAIAMSTKPANSTPADAPMLFAK